MDYDTDSGLGHAALEYELARGGKFVVYQYCVSLLVLTLRRPSRVYFVTAGQSRLTRGLPYTLISLVFGWWGLPWGFIYTPESILVNLSGGRDITDEVAARMGLHIGEGVSPAADQLRYQASSLPSSQPLPIEVRLSWSSDGVLYHEVSGSRYLSPTEVDEALCVTVPLLVSCQLGVLTVGQALALCVRMVSFLETGMRGRRPGISALRGGRIALARRSSDGNRVRCQFWPEGDQPSIADADVSQLIGSYFEAVMTRSNDATRERIGAFTLTGVCFYLELLSQHSHEDQRLRASMHYPSVMLGMVPYTLSVYDRWNTGEMPSDVGSLTRLVRDMLHSAQSATD